MGAFVHEATYDFDFDSAAAATVVERSLRRELGEIDDERSTAVLQRDGSTLRIVVEASDIVPSVRLRTPGYR